MDAIIHCSDSPQGRGDNAETIHGWHKQNGWDGIGYHYVILEDGTVEAGRPIYWSGAHARGHNDKIGICLIGINQFTEDQFEALYKLLNDLEVEEIKGHYEVDKAKSCPNIDMDWLRAMWEGN